MTDVEAPSTTIDEPRSAKDIKPEQLQPKFELFPNLCPDLRKKAYTWYPGPTLCGHKMHWTEYIFVVFTALGIVYFILGTGVIKASIVGISLMVLSGCALTFVWGFAKMKSLADLAEKLEKIATANHNEVKALTAINDEWDRSMQENTKNVDNFTKQMGLVSDDAESLDKVKDVLQALVQAKRNLQIEEKRLFETTVKAEQVTAAEAREKQIHVLKLRAQNIFERIDRRNKLGAGKSDGELEGEEVEKFKEELLKDEFLNQFEWIPILDDYMDDGKLKQYEALHMLEMATDSYFIKMKRAFEEEGKLKEQLEALRASSKRR